MFDIFQQMSDIFFRLNKVAEYHGIKKPSEFSKKTGISHQSASNYLKGERTPTAEALSMIVKSLPLVDLTWLLTGEGEMLKPDNNINQDGTINNYKSKFKSGDIATNENNEELIKLTI